MPGEPLIDLAVFCQNLAQVCCSGWRPRLLTGFIRLWLTEHFSDPARIEEDLLRQRVWKPTDDTGILIESVTRWRPNTTEKRPALVVKRHGLKVLRQGINDRKMMAAGPDATRLQYVTFLQGAHTVYCVAGESGETELLAGEVLRELIHFAVVLRAPMGLHKLSVLEVGELGLLEEASENFVVPITVAYAFEEAWETPQQAPALKAVDLTLFEP